MKVFSNALVVGLVLSSICLGGVAKATVTSGSSAKIMDDTVDGGRRKAPPKDSDPGTGAPTDSGGGDIHNLDVCFSPAGNCDQKLVSFISSATKTLDIAIYSITLSSIAQAIQDAQSRGVQVRMVVDRSQSNGTHSLVSQLKSAGINLKIGNVRGILHDKFTIRDGSMIETGSYNYTENATQDNAENQIYLDDSGVVSQYVQQFETLYQNGLE